MKEISNVNVEKKQQSIEDTVNDYSVIFRDFFHGKDFSANFKMHDF